MNTLTSAFQYAEAGSLEDWIHLFLTGEGNNIPFSEGLKSDKRYYFGPYNLKLELFERCCGPEPDMQYVVGKDSFETHVTALVNRIKEGWDMPPLIVNYSEGKFELNDGNHRYEAMIRKGLKAHYFIIRTTGESDASDFKLKYGGVLIP